MPMEQAKSCAKGVSQRCCKFIELVFRVVMIVILTTTVVNWLGRNINRQRAWRRVLDDVFVPMQKGNSLAMSVGRVKAIKAMLDLEGDNVFCGMTCIDTSATVVVRMIRVLSLCL